MSSPAEWYNSLPPVSKFFGTACLVFTAASQIGIIPPYYYALLYELVFYRFQVFRLFTNFFFLGKFSVNFAIRLLMIARYGTQLETVTFQGRTADFLWMMIFGSFTLLVLSAISLLWTPFLAPSLVFMLLYVWSREFPTANINIYGLLNIKAFYLPWTMLCLDVLFGSPIVPDLLGIIAGHLYYFLTVLYPLSSGKNLLKTPQWLRKLVARSRYLRGATNTAPRATTTSTSTSSSNTAERRNEGGARGSSVFTGRSYRLGG